MHIHPAVAPDARARAAVVASCIAAALGIVLWVQYGMGIAPCHLCYGERVPYYAALPVALALALGLGRSTPRLAAAAMAVLCVLLAWALWLGLYHAGVEHGWWAGPSTCTNLGGPADARPLLEQLATLDVVPCDKVRVRMAGFSLAELNALLAGALLVHAMRGLSRQVRRRRAGVTVPARAAATTAP